MPRNLYHRVEIAVPVSSELLPRVKRECLDYYLNDNCFAWELDSEGNYARLSKRAGKTSDQKNKTKWLSAQQTLIDTLSHPTAQND